jgi:hypothetical protein
VEDVTPVALYADSKLGMEVGQGELLLPARYLRPILRPAPGERAIAQVYLVRSSDPIEDARARKRAALERMEDGGKPEPRPSPDAPVAWKVFALRRTASPRVALELEPERGAPVQRITWEVGKGAPGKPSVLGEWAFARLRAQDVFGPGDGPLQRPLAIAAVHAYGLDEGRLRALWDRFEGSDDRGEPSLLALLGGRAAVDETLQLDRALAMELDRTGQASIPIGSVEGVTVAAHPWKEMLAGRTPPRLPLADCVPPDRSLLYLPQPREAVDGFEHGAAGFLQRVSSFAGEGRLDYAIVERYLEDLGLGDGLGRKLLKLGAVKEALVFTTDLSLLSGTDVTVVAEISPLFLPLLPIPEGEVREKETPSGRSFKARRGSRAFISTSRAELERALALDAAGGAGSLGRSDELAYLLLKLSPTGRTQAFAYLSDPFIRRLVGPAQRIAESRRDRARVDMELIAGAALLRRQDAPGAAPTIEELVRLGYLAPPVPLADYTLRPDGRVASATWGPLERLRPVSHVPLASVTSGEAERYRSFREGYTRYWRRFFDPIALRLDAGRDGGQELETFILPLLDSSIYRELAREIAPAARPTLSAPRWSFPASIEASVQLPAQIVEGAGGGPRIPSELEHAGLVIPADVLDSIVPTLHVAFPDAAPILQVGGGSAFGVLTAPTQRGGAAIPMLIAAFTRPMAIAVELKDPERVRRALDRMTSPPPRARSRRLDYRIQVARDADDRLIVTADLFGAVTLRHSIRVEDRWLVIANDTTLPAKLIAGSQELRGAGASVALRPGTLRLGLPAAWQAASDAEANSAWAAQHWLAPWLAQGASVEEAQGASRALLGSAPLLEPDALLRGPNQGFENRRFGTRARPRVPPLETKGDFGLFEGISEGRVEMSFEEDGLRSRVTWRGGQPR